MLNAGVRKKLLAANLRTGVEFPAKVAEQQNIEFHAPDYLHNVIRIITETGLRVYRKLAPMRKDQVDLENAVVWIPDS
jgi:hypothetical protein